MIHNYWEVKLKDKLHLEIHTGKKKKNMFPLANLNINSEMFKFFFLLLLPDYSIHSSPSDLCIKQSLIPKMVERRKPGQKADKVLIIWYCGNSQPIKNRNIFYLV